MNFGNAGLDKYYNVDNLYGSAKDDYLFGNSNSNIIEGRDGDDKIFGAGGNIY
jgi:Ca2+-binding RTX toxin-like protein